MFNRKSVKTIVVGAGPVGMTAAVALRRRGIKAEIFDQADRSATHSYALALHPATLECLDKLGLAGPVLKAAVRVRRVSLGDPEGPRATVDLGLTSEKFPYVAVLPQSHLELILESALKADGGVHWNHRVATIDIPDSDGDVHLSVERLANQESGYAVMHSERVVDKDFDYKTGFLIAADGVDSLVRQQLNIGFSLERPSEHLFAFECETSHDFEETAILTYRDGLASAAWPLGSGIARLAFQVPPEIVPEEIRVKDRMLLQGEANAYSFLNESMRDRLLAERLPMLTGRVGAIRWKTATPFDMRLADRLLRGRAILVGDAAHSASPFGYQSMNGGMQEAVVYADLIASFLQSGEQWTALEQRVETDYHRWHSLLADAADVRSVAETSPWVADHARLLPEHLPAVGRDLDGLLAQLHLQANSAGVVNHR